MSKQFVSSPLLLLTAACCTLALAACDRSPKAPAAEPAGATATADTAAADAAAKAAADAQAQLAAKEKELNDREAALKQQELEAELAKRDAATAAAAVADERAKAAAAASAAAAAKKKAGSSTAKATTAPAKATPAPLPPLVVPAGTQIAVALTSDVSTKTAKVGDSVQGTLQSDVMIGSRKAASAGAPVKGSINQVVSGSKKIGGIPTLGITFDTLVAADGSSVPIGAQLLQQGTSDTGKDTAKILGGAAAGAIIGHQVNHKNGSVVGGILGGVAGTAAAKNTGGEVVLPAGTVVSVSTSSPFQVD